MPGKMVTTSNLISVAFSCVLDVEQPVGHDDPAPRDVDLDAWLALPAPLHVVLGAVQQQARPRVETILEICQGRYLDSPIETIRPHNLPDSDHALTSPLDGRRPRGAKCWPVIGALARSTKTRLRSRDDATRTSVRMASMLRPALPIDRKSTRL